MDRADVVVVGGGVVGLSVAYNLAKRGAGKIAVIEQRYAGSGASTRNACGITTQFGAKENITLAKEGKEIFEELSKELEFNILYLRGGSLLVSSNEKEAKILRSNTRTQNTLGIPSRLLSPSEVEELFPYISGAGIVNASYNPTDGKVHHDAVVWAYKRAAERLGVEVNTYTEVKAIGVEGGEVRSVHTNKGEIKTGIIVNAAGVLAGGVARMAGVELPIKPHRVEAMVSEALKYFLDPRILSISEHLFLTQSLRGELVGGITVTKTPSSITSQSSLTFLEAFAREIVKLVPQLRFVNLMRQWVGYFDTTPDGSPILGPVEEVEGFIQANGFNGYGFTMAPVVGRLIAEWITAKRTSIPIDPFYLNRFRENRLLRENTVSV